MEREKNSSSKCCTNHLKKSPETLFDLASTRFCNRFLTRKEAVKVLSQCPRKDEILQKLRPKANLRTFFREELRRVSEACRKRGRIMQCSTHPKRLDCFVFLSEKHVIVTHPRYIHRWRKYFNHIDREIYCFDRSGENICTSKCLFPPPYHWQTYDMNKTARKHKAVNV
jgi:hypothetical protein